MIRYNLLILIITSLLILSGCDKPSDTAANNLEAQAWTMIEQGALLVDVRTQQEYDQGALENSLHIPHDQVATKIVEFGNDKNRQIVLYCRSGNRAGKAEAILREMGYQNILNAGGYEAMIKHKQQ